MGKVRGEGTGEELGVKGGGHKLSICYAVNNTAGVCSGCPPARLPLPTL